MTIGDKGIHGGPQDLSNTSTPTFVGVNATGDIEALGTIHAGEDDNKGDIEVHNAGTIKLWDAGDDTSVTIGPVGNGTTKAAVTGSIDVSGDVEAATIGATTAGTIRYLVDEDIEAATDTLTANQCSGGLINNYGQANDMTLTLPAAAAGMSFTVILGTTVAKYFRIDPNASDSVYLDGVTTGDGKYIGVASAAIGNAVACQTFQTGASAYDWFCATVSGAWVAEA